MDSLLAAKNRVADTVYAQAAIGPVLVGSPNGPQTQLLAENDGVATIDATSGVNYGTYTSVMQTFINKDVPMEMIGRSRLLITGKENTALMNEEKFINNNYVGSRPVEAGTVNKVGQFGVILFGRFRNRAALRLQIRFCRKRTIFVTVWLWRPMR